MPRKYVLYWKGDESVESVAAWRILSCAPAPYRMFVSVPDNATADVMNVAAVRLLEYYAMDYELRAHHTEHLAALKARWHAGRELLAAFVEAATSRNDVGAVDRQITGHIVTHEKRDNEPVCWDTMSAWTHPCPT